MKAMRGGRDSSGGLDEGRSGQLFEILKKKRLSSGVATVARMCATPRTKFSFRFAFFS